MQLSLSLIQHDADGSVVSQRIKDGYINATALCKAAGKKFFDYKRNSATDEFLKELSSQTGIPVLLLIQQVTDSYGHKSTWVHPQVAINLGQWASPKFAVRVTQWVSEWMTNRTKPSSELPPHIRRYMMNDHKIPTGYFSILQETVLGIIGPLNNVGYDIPENCVPDISVGKLFCKWLRDKKGMDADSFNTYQHEYPDGRVVPAKLYPDSVLADYRKWLRTVWLPTHGIKYFKRKDSKSLEYLNKLPALKKVA